MSLSNGLIGLSKYLVPVILLTKYFHQRSIISVSIIYTPGWVIFSSLNITSLSNWMSRNLVSNRLSKSTICLTSIITKFNACRLAVLLPFCFSLLYLVSIGGILNALLRNNAKSSYTCSLWFLAGRPIWQETTLFFSMSYYYPFFPMHVQFYRAENFFLTSRYKE